MIWSRKRGSKKTIDTLNPGETDYAAYDISGAELTELEWYITRAFPDPLYTDRFTLPDHSAPYANLHCLVMTGHDGETLYFADPMQEVSTTDAETFTLRYDQMGQDAVVIV